MFSPVRHGWWALNVTLTFIVGAATVRAAERDPVALFTQTGLPRESIALSIQSADGKRLVEHQPHLPFNPASTIKVVTTRAALGILGEDFRFRTQIFGKGSLRSGVFDGTLVLKGGGDPKLIREDLEEIVGQLRAKGYRELRGEWRLDGGLFSEPEASPAQFDGQPLKPYNVIPHAGMLNFKSVGVVLSVSGRQVKAQVEPALYGLSIAPKIKLLLGSCEQNRFTPIWRPPRTLMVEGQMGRQCPGAEFYVGVFDHLEFAYRLFAQTWIESGGRIRMHPRTGPTPPEAQRLLEWTSPRPLIELAGDINKRSNNPMARTVFLGISAQTGGNGTSADAQRKIHLWLEGRGLQFPEMVLENGSGLSRHERISARHMTALLLDGLKGADASRWIETLPAAGIDGTLRRRLKDPSVLGRAWVKTGTLDDVRAYAGYVRANSGRLIAFSAFVNHPEARLAREPLDKLVEWMIEHL
ncbi:MAG: D-alanyl-D-alanine carboxypeptidase/D-alanyl-D-alanine-endopeptidase [Pseudomonadota bacterium]